MPGTPASNFPPPAELLAYTHARAFAMLAENPDPGLQARLRRDVLAEGQALAGDRLLLRALQESVHIQQLALEQQVDGGWGRFHSRNSSLKRRVPTTEWAVARALALGLPPNTSLLRKSARYIQGLLTWKLPFPDPPEVNDRWPLGRRLFSAATLARLDPENPQVQQERTLWLEIASRTFASGRYRAGAERGAHAELTGASVENSYLRLNGHYQLRLLGSGTGGLPERLDRPLVEWLWSLPQGVGYYRQKLGLPAPVTPAGMDNWLASHELLACCSPYWARRAEDVLRWLWDQRQPDGYWDFGPRPPCSPRLPLSESWRSSANRRRDWTARLLALLAAYARIRIDTEQAAA
jgi:hypothetical protein